MQALAMSRVGAFDGGSTSAGGQGATTVVPAQTLFPAPLDPPFFVIVQQIVGSALAVHLAGQEPFLTSIGLQFLTEHLQLDWTFPREDRETRRADVQTDDIRARAVLGFLVSMALNRELHHIAMTPGIGPFGVGAGDGAAHEPDILHAAFQPMHDHRIVPIDHQAEG